MAIDKELLKAIEQMNKGNSEAFGVFYEHTCDYVYKRARFIMKNEEDALDLTQETYVQAYKNISSLEKTENVYAWLGAIAYRQGMRIFRDRKEVLVDEEGDYVFEDIVSEDKDYSPEENADAQATVDIVMGFIDELPELQRAAIIAFYYDNKKIDEIAEEAGCSSNTIKSRLNYAKKFLKDKVESHEKACGYKLHSVTPFIIFSALGGVLGGNAYTISAQASEMVLAGVSGATGVAVSASGATVVATSASAGAISSVASTGAAVAAKVGLGLGAKIAIGVATVTLAGGITIASLGSKDQTGMEKDSQTTLSEESDDEVAGSEQGSEQGGEQGSANDAEDEVVYPSVWEQSFEGYIQSGTSHIFLTDDKYGYLLSEDTLIYVVNGQGDYAVVANKNDAGERLYKSISSYAAHGLVAKLTKEDGTYDYLYADGKCVDEVEEVGTNNTLFGGTYMWDGTTLWDGNHNAVDVPVPAIISGLGEVDFLDIYDTDGTMAIVQVAVTTTEGEGQYYEYKFDSQLNIRENVDGPTNMVWVDNGEVLVMREGFDGDRFIALASDKKPLFWIYDWAIPMGEIYETNVDTYSINAYMYDDGVMLVEITVYYSNEKDGDVFTTNAFFLYEEDGYAIDKAVNLGRCDYLSNRDDIWYNTTTGFLLIDGQVSYHKWMFEAGDGIYYYEVHSGDDGGVYTIYTASGDKVCTIEDLVKGVVNKNAYVVHTDVNGSLKYKLIEAE